MLGEAYMFYIGYCYFFVFLYIQYFIFFIRRSQRRLDSLLIAVSEQEQIIAVDVTSYTVLLLICTE